MSRVPDWRCGLVEGQTLLSLRALKMSRRFVFFPGFDWFARVSECRSLESYVIDIIESLLLTL